MLFLIRIITATLLFAFLAKANIWLNPLSNIILALGYRVFLLLSPFLVFISGRFALTITLLIATSGVAVIFMAATPLMLALGAFLVAIGFSTNGYIIKTKATETPKGAGYNKIAINLGGLFSGILLIIFTQSKSIFFGLSGIILLITTAFTLIYCNNQQNIVLAFPKKIYIKRIFAWAAIGIAIGIKFFGVFTILPQILVHNLGALPKWYGVLLFINAGVVIIFQLPILHFFEKLSKNNNSNIFKLTIIVMVFGMLLISLPYLFNINQLYGAITWTLLLSVVECCSSYLDFTAADKGYLLTKEISIGVGAGLTVFISRYSNSTFSPIILGGIGTILLIYGYYYLREDFK